MERDAGASVCAMAERISALAGGDVFRAEGGHTDGKERDGIFLEGAVGSAEVSALDEADAEGSAGEDGTQGVGRQLPATSF